MTDKDLEQFEQEADRTLEKLSAGIPVSETKVLSPRVLEILVDNINGDEEVEYSTSKNTFHVRFSFTEVKMENGNLGVYEDLPDDFDPSKAASVVFLVRGFHKNQETEVLFSKGKMILNREREHGHLIDFQRAVLMKGK